MRILVKATTFFKSQPVDSRKTCSGTLTPITTYLNSISSFAILKDSVIIAMQGLKNLLSGMMVSLKPKSNQLEIEKGFAKAILNFCQFGNII